MDLGAELRPDSRGALVVGVAAEARAAGLRPGDVVVAANDYQLAGWELASIRELAFHPPPGENATWAVLRGGERLVLHARAPGAPEPALYAP